jgi:Uma2 family endonuclease
MKALLLDRPTKWRFTLEDVRRMWDEGKFPNYPSIELIDGEVFEMPADGWRTTNWNALFNRWLVTATDPSVVVVPDKTLAVGEDGLKPDFWVYPASIDPRTVTGADCLLVIELSDTTLRWDIGRKASRYALGGVRDYWVIDVEGRQVFVHRLGSDGTYGEPLVFGAEEAVVPVLMPELALVLRNAVGPKPEGTEFG